MIGRNHQLLYKSTKMRIAITIVYLSFIIAFVSTLPCFLGYTCQPSLQPLSDAQISSLLPQLTDVALNTGLSAEQSLTVSNPIVIIDNNNNYQYIFSVQNRTEKSFRGTVTATLLNGYFAFGQRTIDYSMNPIPAHRSRPFAIASYVAPFLPTEAADSFHYNFITTNRGVASGSGELTKKIFDTRKPVL